MVIEDFEIVFSFSQNRIQKSELDNVTTESEWDTYKLLIV